jgi:LPS-assembly protein
LTPFGFIDGQRRYSPITNLVRISPEPRWGVEWRADYDPLKKRITNSGVSVDGRYGSVWGSLSHQVIRSNPLLSPNTNQLIGSIALGRDSRPGFNLASRINYDYRTQVINEVLSQLSYNTNCCGFSIQYGRIGLQGNNILRYAFTVANIGSFGNIRRQDRMY